MPTDNEAPARPDAMAVEDILAAMRRIDGYLDVSPADALALYRLAYAHAAQRLGRDVPVRDIMTATPATASPETTARDAARIMAAARVSGLPVVSGQTVVGVLSLTDLLRLLGLPADAGPAALIARLMTPAACTGAHPTPALGQTPVAALMTSPAVVVGPDVPRSEAARLMTGRGVNRLPVVDGTGLCGIVSRGDVVRSCRGVPGGCPA